MGVLPQVSVIIPTLNEEEFIEKCLLGLLHQKKSPLEIIVVDGGSTDNTIKIARKMGVKTISKPNIGTGIARNIGALEAKGDILAFIDADVIPHPQWCESIVNYFHKHPEIIGAAGTKIMNSKNKFLRWLYFFLTYSLQKFLLIFNFAWFSGTNVAYRKEWFIKLGGFKTTELSEDILLSLQASRIGKMGHHGGIVYASDRRIESEGFLSFALFYIINIFPTLRGKPIGYYPKISELKNRKKYSFIYHFKNYWKKSFVKEKKILPLSEKDNRKDLMLIENMQ